MILLVLAGLPGSGKSTVASAVARELRWPVFPVDPVDRALWDAGVTEDPGRPPGIAAYLIAEGLAELQLNLGLSVVIDAVNSVEPARQQWRDLAARTEAALRFVEVVCSDADEHRRRVEERRRTDPAYAAVDWAVVQARAEEWAPWTDERLTVDTSAPGAVAAVVERLSRSAMLGHSSATCAVDKW